MLLLLSLIGCTGTIVQEIPGTPCRGIESRTSMFNTQGAIVCFNKQGELTAMTGGPGTSQIAVGFEIIKAATVVGGAVILADGLGKTVPQDFQLNHDVVFPQIR